MYGTSTEAQYSAELSGVIPAGKPSNFIRASARPTSSFSFSPSSIRIGTGSTRMFRSRYRPLIWRATLAAPSMLWSLSVKQMVRTSGSSIVQISATSLSPVRLSMST